MKAGETNGTWLLYGVINPRTGLRAVFFDEMNARELAELHGVEPCSLVLLDPQIFVPLAGTPCADCNGSGVTNVLGRTTRCALCDGEKWAAIEEVEL